MRPLEDLRILVVEDDYLVAQDICAILDEAGAVAVGPVGRIKDALDLIAHNKATLDGAVLDIDLRGETSYPIADLLGELGIPFVFATGYNTDAIASAYEHHPHCLKPVDVQNLVAGLRPGQPGID